MAATGNAKTARANVSGVKSKGVQKTKAKTGAGSSKKTTSKAKVSAGELKEPIVKKSQYDNKEAARRMEIKLWSSLAVTAILELSNFGIMGIVGDFFSRIMFGMFGLFAYIFPILLFIGYMFLMVNAKNSKAVMKVTASGLLFLMMCTMAQLIATGNDRIEFFKVCAREKAGGGWFGGMIGTGLASVLAIPGAVIIILAIMIICLIVITEKSFVGGIRKGYEATKDNIDRIKNDSEMYYNSIEKEKRYNKKARGIINYEFKNPKHVDENMHEIHSVYRGPIKQEDIKTEEIKQEKEDEPEEIRVVEREIYELPARTKLTKTAEVKEEQNVQTPPAMEEERDENEPFVPKEKIEVSKAAKSIMNRPAFTGTAPVKKEPESTSNIPKAPDVSKGVMTAGEAGEVKNVTGPKKKIFRYEFPPLSLLKKGNVRKNTGRTSGLSDTAMRLQEILKTFGVNASVTNESRGPSVTRYELQPELGTKVSKITSLTDDIKLNLAAADIRIEAPIPGKAAVGIEVPNDTREPVFLRDLLESQELKNNPSKLAFAAGMDIAGNVVVADIAKMPHMLIAGTTGSGKSVFTNSILLSILFRADPTEVKLIIVDPKVVEFGVYNGIPHLLTPVVTDPKKAAGALAWAVQEMQDRYEKFAELGVRDVKGYNAKIKDIEVKEDEVPPQRMPQILIIIDELADLMMVAAKEVESSICRLAQLARAAGIHLIIATQRPSVDVVTGLIKANIPSRVALLVSSGVDSRTIIDINGAEKLLGNGDMLFYPSGYVKPVRLQGAFVSDGEVQSVVEFILSHTEKAEYNEEITKQSIGDTENTSDTTVDLNEDSRDAYFAEAGKFVIEKGKGSTSMLQRMYRIGFNRAARIMDQLYEAGVVGDEEGTKPRKILMTQEEFEEYLKKEDISK